MLVKKEGSKSAVARQAAWLVPIGLVVGLLYFDARAPVADLGGSGPSAPTGDEAVAPGGSDGLHRNLRRAPDGSAETGDTRAGENRLATLRIDLPDSSARRLQAVRDRAIAVGVIVQEPADTVPATVEFGGRSFAAEVRIKGDWLDHVESDQWSLRIKLDRPGVLGMRVFSIQAPETVGYLWEWLVHEAMRYEGVLAPRSTMVNVELRGNDAGVYFLQEHFAKELLESQERREGPIVRFDETALWDLMLQHDLELPAPAPVRSGLVIDTARVSAFGEKRLQSSDSLRRGLADAIEKMRTLRSLAIAARTSGERLRRLEAMNALEEASIESVLNIDRFARAHAVASVFQLEHALFWHNLRFYHDPVLQRLEPIMFDNMAHVVSDPDPVPLRGEGYVTRFRTCRAYYDGVFRHLGRLVEPGYLERFFGSIGPEFDRLASSMPAGAKALMRKRLFAQRDYLAKIVRPVHPASFAATFSLDDPDSPQIGPGVLEVTAWATTRSPVVVEGFRFGNGRFVSGRSALVDRDAGPGPSGSTRAASYEGTGVVLPHDGRVARFRFAMDERLTGLGSVRELKRAIRAGSLPMPEVIEPSVVAEFRPLGASGAASEELVFRRHDVAWDEEGERPAAPTLEASLAAHPFLSFDYVTGELIARAGTWDVAGDLVAPHGMTLLVEAGTTLRFEPGAVLVTTGRLNAEGTEDEPVVFAPRPESESWGGIVVLEAPSRSEWTHATVRSTRAVMRGGWVVTGGVTFYRSSVSMTDCAFEGSLAEDALNVFAADLQLDAVSFERCASDCFDGDFVSGLLSGCTFRGGAGDGIDLSGSRLEVRGCRFEDLGDKAISAGEGTRLEVDGGLARGVSIGIASKDGSHVSARDFGIERVGEFALAVYVKKEAFGPATLEAEKLRLGADTRTADELFLVQTSCVLTVDGRSITAQDVDVERLYREGILGR